MSRATLSYEDPTTKYQLSVMLHRIVRLSKESADEDAMTLIHLDTGEILRTNDPLKVLDARINAAYDYRPANVSPADQ